MRKTALRIVTALFFMIFVIGNMPCSFLNSEEVNQERREEIESFVGRLYETTLDRQPDPEGLDYWVDSLINQSRTGVDVAHGFIYSSEFQQKHLSDDEYIEKNYEAFFGRGSDPTGKGYWSDILSLATTRETGRAVLFAGFVNSLEYSELCLSYGIVKGEYYSLNSTRAYYETEGFVSRIYDYILKRNYDDVGLGDWVTKLVLRESSGLEVVWGFILSAEYSIDDKSIEEYITDLYLVFLDRLPSEEDILYWSSIGDGYAGRKRIFNGIGKSEEFGLMCERYDVEVGDEIEITTLYYGGTTTFEELKTTGFQQNVIDLCEAWMAHEPHVRYQMGGKSLEAGAIDCSGFVTQIYRRALGTMAPSNPDFSQYVNDIRNYSGYQDTTYRGSWRGYNVSSPILEGSYSIYGSYGRMYVDRYGMGSPLAMNVADWFYYLRNMDIRYVYVNCSEIKRYGDWEFVYDYSAGDIVIWSDYSGGFMSYDTVHIGIYDGDGGVYHSGGGVGLSHTPIWNILSNPASTPSRLMYIFRMSKE